EAWQTRFEALFAGLADGERDRMAARLRSLLSGFDAEQPTRGDGSVTQGRVDVRADRGAFAAGVFQGELNLSRPTVPVPEQG
ncbi:hypothetical protein ACFV23_54670, partial [Streptomyces sp. NPDC059627]